ncbi:MAG: hypothetical protein QM820_59880 [Minicystis sp.]
MPSLVFEQTPLCIVMLMGRNNPSDAEWDTYLSAIAAGIAAGMPARALVISNGGAPTPAQRARLEKATTPISGQLKAAIVTGSTFVRGVLNAMALVNRGYRAFPPDKLDEAFAYLDIRPANAGELRAAVAQLRANLGEGPANHQ